MSSAYEPSEEQNVHVFDDVENAAFSVAFVDPDPERRQTAAAAMTGTHFGAVRQIVSYLPDLTDARWLTQQGFDAVFVGLDYDSEAAFATVEALTQVGSAIIVVYSESTDSELLMRAMRCGAREFLRFPFGSGVLKETLQRVANRMRTSLETENCGELFAFFGAKGGVGVTTLACNFAISLANESGKKTLLLDLDLPLGDAILDLGLHPEYSTIEALAHPNRLDGSLLDRLLVRHSSGIAVLGAPGTHVTSVLEEPAVRKLIHVARQAFDYVVVDAGSSCGPAESLLFALASRIYLVTQAGIPELRNANRLITGGLSVYTAKTEIILNRCSANSFGIDGPAIDRALTRPPDWKVPNDYSAVRKMQIGASPLALTNTPIASVLQKMARRAGGLPTESEAAKGRKLLRAWRN